MATTAVLVVLAVLVLVGLVAALRRVVAQDGLGHRPGPRSHHDGCADRHGPCAC